METGNYGQVREAYAAARQAFPTEVLDYIWQHISNDHPSVIDLGCGTGIATRQLAAYPFTSIVGSDVDEWMIATAAEQPAANIIYITAPTQQLPLADQSFTAATAFSAFHWFKDQQSLAEIKRVLQKHGIFFVINKNDTRGFRKGYKQKLATLLGVDLTGPKEVDYNPAQILTKAGFTAVTTKVFSTSETFTPAAALQHIQSAAAWSQIPPDKEAAAIALMEEHIRGTMINDHAIRELEVVVISGIKN